MKPFYNVSNIIVGIYGNGLEYNQNERKIIYGRTEVAKCKGLVLRVKIGLSTLPIKLQAL